MHLQAAVQALAVRTVDAAAHPPHHIGLLGHRVRAGMDMAGVAQSREMAGIGLQFWQIGLPCMHKMDLFHGPPRRNSETRH